MPDFGFDFGNARGKYHFPAKSAYGSFRHAIAPLRESDWRKVAARGNPPNGIVKINGMPYAVGDAARRYTIPERPEGAARYHANYYGIGLAFALSEAFDKSQRDIFLIASHAPQDIDYADALERAAIGKYEVHGENGELTFNVRGVYTYDEPLGGYSHYILTENGAPKQRNPLLTATTLVVDVGGYTVDVCAVDPGGVIDVLSLRSTRIGGNHMTRRFTEDLRSNNRLLFQDAGELDIRRVESAILTGQYQYGNTSIDCRQEANEAITELVNDVILIMKQAGGGTIGNFEKALITGGFGALIYKKLSESVPRIDFMMADSVNMQYANVFGGPKIVALLRKEGVL